MKSHVFTFFKAIFLFTLMAFVAVPSVGAVAYDWSYSDPVFLGGGVISGSLEGTPTAGDSNLVTVAGLSDISFESSTDASQTGPLPIGPLDFIFSFDTAISIPPTAAPTVSLDGTFMDLYAGNDLLFAPATQFIGFFVGNQFTGSFGSDGWAFLIPGLGFTSSSWDPDAWTLSEAASVPEPATMLLLGSGLIALAGFRRKGKKA